MFDKLALVKDIFVEVGEWRKLGVEIKDEIKVARTKFQDNRKRFLKLLEEIMFNWSLVTTYLDNNWNEDVWRLFLAMNTSAWDDILNDDDMNLKLFFPNKVRRKVLPKKNLFKVQPGLKKYLRRSVESLLTGVYGRIRKNKEFGAKLSDWSVELKPFIEEYSLLIRLITIKTNSKG